MKCEEGLVCGGGVSSGAHPALPPLSFLTEKATRQGVPKPGFPPLPQALALYMGFGTSEEPA